ncbi:MAG: hypothetical protein ACFCU6_12980 [Balneolaceae bacterium]
MTVYNDSEERSALHERINILKKKGYLGFSIVNTDRKWDGCKVTARNDEGKVISAEGESIEEAYKKLIDRIDLVTE